MAKCNGDCKACICTPRGKDPNKPYYECAFGRDPSKCKRQLRTRKAYADAVYERYVKEKL